MNYKKVGIAADHAGFRLKEYLKKKLSDKGYELYDFGCHSAESCDYPEFGHPMAKALSSNEIDIAFSMCGSGNGINMVVNKHKGIRSALCWNKEITELARAHNDANVCALPARFVSPIIAWQICEIFLSTDFDGGRHQRRINKIPIED